MEEQHLKIGVGSLSEKPVHAVLKNYYSQNPANQEINIGSFVADIANSSGIIEIQTAGFGRMREKLKFFLTQSPVRIVYPVPNVKWISWLNTDTGELTPRRRSPKKTAVYSIFRELYSLGEIINHPNIFFTIALLEVEEQRLLNGWSYDKKRGSQKNQTLPMALLGEIVLDNPSDFSGFIPDNIPEIFTSLSLQKEARLSQKQAFYLTKVLRTLGVIKQVGKDKNCILYSKSASALGDL